MMMTKNLPPADSMAGTFSGPPDLPRSPSSPLESVPGPTPQPTSPPRLAIILLCWFVILGIVGTEVYFNASRSSGDAATPSDNPTLTAVGHCVVGAHAMGAQSKPGDPDPMAPLIDQLQSAAKSPADHLRVAIICKEIHATTQASDQFSAVEKTRDLKPALRNDLESLQIVYRAGPEALSAKRRKALIADDEWFAQVALSYGLPDQTPIRSKMLAGAKRACLAYTGAFFVGGGGLLLGIALIVLAIVLASTGRVLRRYRPPLSGSSFLEAFAIYLAGFVILSLLLKLLLHSTGIGWSLVLTIMLPIALAWPAFRGKPWKQTRMEFGWHRGRGIFIEICCGIAGYLASIPLLAIMFLITLLLIRLSGTTPSHPVMKLLGGGPGEIVLIYFIACVWAPVFEESMFRGALFNHLRATHGWWVSAGLVGLLFAAVHPQGWTLIPALGGIGMVLCALREWRGSLIASMAAHALNNGLVLTLALLTT